MIPPTRMRAISARGDSLRKKSMRSPSRTREALVRRRRRVFLDRRRNRRDNKLKTFRKKSRRIRRVLQSGNKLRRRAVLAMTGCDHGRDARMLRIDLVQFFVQLRRTGKGQRHKKSEQNADPNASTRLHLPPRLHRGELARKKFLPVT
jgi:hypothetical protein